ncbi:TadE/TadG family type IV pilus assembly protein [Micromonospora sp. NPDC003197]
MTAGMTRTGNHSRPGTRGSVSVEVAVLIPAFLALVVVAGVSGRTALAYEAIEVAAHDAARAASISRTAGSAREAARVAARERLDWEGLSCANSPRLDFAGTVAGRPATFDAAFRSPVGQDASVSVTVSCRVSFQNLRMSILPGMPSDKLVKATFVSPLDRYRSRSG